MTSPSRAMARAARKLADQQSGKVQAAARPRAFIGTVTAVAAGAASDGNAVVSVTYFGVQFTAACYAAAYTPAVGDRVLCQSVDNQPIVLCRLVGFP